MTFASLGCYKTRMARAPRIEYAGAAYHVINRGVERRTIFAVPRDHDVFLNICERLKERHKVSLWAYCLMPNHYHLFLRTALPNLSRFMKELNGGYGKKYNGRCRRIGPVFQGRYRALLVQGSEYALDVARYIHMNPVKAGLVGRPEDYRWSSYRECVGGRGRGIVDRGFLLEFLSGSLANKIRQLRRFTTAEVGKGYDPAQAKGGVVAGVKAFVEWVRREKIPRKKPPDLARWKELAAPGSGLRRSLERRIEGLTGDSKLRRKLLVYALKRSTPLTMKEIARMAGMRTAIGATQAARRLEIAGQGDASLAEILAKLDRRLREGQR